MAAGAAPSASSFASSSLPIAYSGVRGVHGGHGSHASPSCVHMSFSRRPSRFQDLRAYNVCPNSSSAILRLRVRIATRGSLRYAAKLGLHQRDDDADGETSHADASKGMLTSSVSKVATILLALSWPCLDVQAAMAGPMRSAMDYGSVVFVNDHKGPPNRQFVGGPQNWGSGAAPPVRNFRVSRDSRVSAVSDGAGSMVSRGRGGSRHVGGLRYSQGKIGKGGSNLERRGGMEVSPAGFGSSSSISTLPTASMAGLSFRAAAFSLSFPVLSVPAIALDAAIVRASAAASLKLFTLCAFVVWLQKSGQLPESTPSVLSQVAFKVLIPCFLMSKVASTLASQPVSSLLGLPIVAVVQVLIGAIMGKAGCKLAYRQSSSSYFPTNPIAASGTSDVKILGPQNIASFVNPAGIGIDSNKQFSSKREAVLTAACAFGNSLTLPLVFITRVLGSGDADRAVSYLALYMVGWSPALWTVGYDIISLGDKEDADISEIGSSEGKTFWSSLRAWVERVVNPPLFGVLLGLLIGATPLSHFFIPAREAIPLDGTFSASFVFFSKLTAGVFRPALEAAALLGSATLAVQTVVLASSLSSSVPANFSLSFSEFFNRKKSSSRLETEQNLQNFENMGPEFELGNSISNLNPNSNSGTSVENLENEKVLVGVVVESRKNGVEITKYGTVLAFEQNRERIGGKKSILGGSKEVSRKETLVESVSSGTSASLLDGKSLWIVSFVRLFFLPLVNTALVIALRQAQLIPADPVCALTLMVEGAMPSAQNLVLLAQLRSSTRPLAGVLAGLMLRQYAISVIPVTLWMAVFLSLLSL